MTWEFAKRAAISPPLIRLVSILFLPVIVLSIVKLRERNAIAKSSFQSI